jgi:hypothetical protein
MTDRDPLAQLIESELSHLARSKRIAATLASQKRPCRLRFGSVTASGETQDIALLRLASSLLNEADYRQNILDILRGRMPRVAGRKESARRWIHG